MRIFVISLPEAKDRRSRLLPALAEAGEVSVISAVDGRRLGLAGLRPWCPRPFSARLLREMMPSEIACTVSHGRAMAAFLDGPDTHALILEDDALADAAAIRRVRMIIEALPGLDLIKLGGQDRVTAPGRLVQVVGDTAIIEVKTFGVGAHGYAVSREGAKRLLRALFPVTEPYDLFLRGIHRHRCPIHEASPYPIRLDETADCSTIGERPTTRTRLGAMDAVRSVSAKLSHCLGARSHNIRRFGLLGSSGASLKRWPTG